MDPNTVIVDLHVVPLSQLRQYIDIARASSDVQQLSRATNELDHRFMNMQVDFLAAQQSVIQTQAQVTSMTANLAATTKSIVAMQKTKPHSSLKYQPPAKFGGDATMLRTWLFSVRQYFIACGISDQVKMQQYAATMLEKEALIWWESHCMQQPSAPATWTFEVHFVPALQTAFRDLGHEQRVLAQFEQWSNVKGESIDAYIARFRQLYIALSQVNHVPDDATLIHKFTLRLPADARFWFGVQKPITIEDAYQLAQDWSAADQMRSGKLPTHVPNVAQSGVVPMDIDALQQQIASLQQQLNAVTGPSSSNTPPQQRNAVSGQCFRCGRTNHLIKQCRARYHVNGSLLPTAQNAKGKDRTSALRWLSAPVSTDEQLPGAPATPGTLN